METFRLHSILATMKWYWFGAS